jgi:hypothetical protein
MGDLGGVICVLSTGYSLSRAASQNEIVVLGRQLNVLQRNTVGLGKMQIPNGGGRVRFGCIDFATKILTCQGKMCSRLMVN